MRAIGYYLLGISMLVGLSACDQAAAAPAPMTVSAAPSARSGLPDPSAAKPRPRAHRRPHVRLPVVHACQRPTHVTATANGRYSGQLRRLYVPADCSSYGSFKDYGSYPATSYAGQNNIPAGYWVYHYPYWYVYGSRNPSAPVTAPGGAYCRPPASTSANANGKYRVLVRRLHVPADCSTYGSFQDYGYYRATSYAGHTNLPSGYWVYRYPYWYLWDGVKP